MKKRLFVSVALVCIVGGHAYAQAPEALKSPVLVSVRACLKDMAANGKNANLKTDETPGTVMVLDPSREKVLPIAIDMKKCIEAAFPSTDLRSGKDGKTPSKVWWAKAGDHFIYCTTTGKPDHKDHIALLGGNGPMRGWHSIFLYCGLGEEIPLGKVVTN